MGGARVPADGSHARAAFFVTLAAPGAIRLKIALVGVADATHRLVAFRRGGDAAHVDVLANGAWRRVVEDAIRVVAEARAEHGVVNWMAFVGMVRSVGQSGLLCSFTVPEINAGGARGLRAAAA